MVSILPRRCMRESANTSSIPNLSLCSTTYMDVQMHTRLDDVLQHLSLNSYSVFSLIDDILRAPTSALIWKIKV